MADNVSDYPGHFGVVVREKEMTEFMREQVRLWPVYAFLIVQTAGATYWAGGMSSDMQQKTNDRFHKSEAVQWFNVRDAKILGIERRIDELNSQVESDLKEIKDDLKYIRRTLMRKVKSLG